MVQLKMTYETVPQPLLEDDIRKELACRIAPAFNGNVKFGNTSHDLDNVLIKSGDCLGAYNYGWCKCDYNGSLPKFGPEPQ